MRSFHSGGPIYYSKMGKRLFGEVIKYPIARLPACGLIPAQASISGLHRVISETTRHAAVRQESLFLDSKSVREKGLDLIDASNCFIYSLPRTQRVARAASFLGTTRRCRRLRLSSLMSRRVSDLRKAAFILSVG